MGNQAPSSSFQAFISRDQIPLTCERRGEGKPLLLFVHGWTCRRSYWLPQLDFFSQKYAVAAFDLPGHGDTDYSQRTEWSLASFANDVVACVKELGAERVILVGHSMGGAVALEAARILGSRVTGVVLVDTFVIDYGGLPVETVQKIVASFEANFTAAIAGLVEQASTAAMTQELKDQLIREMSAADPNWALPVWQDLLSWNPQSAFDELQVPIHAINGALIPDSARERCAPFVTETVIPGAGHFLQMEDPEGFNLVLEGMLARFR